MPLGLAFWIVMLIWAIFALVWHWGVVPGPYGPFGHTVLLFVLLLLLGWQVFGAPIK